MAKRKRNTTDEIKAALSGDMPKDPPVKASDLLSTGSTLLNLACSGRTIGGFPRGRVVLIVGDSDSGKTFISLTCLAEAANDSRFDDYLLIHDDAEGGALMDMTKFFGQKGAARIKAPNYTKEGVPIHSATIEDFYDTIESLQDAGRPFIYVMDSVDVLTSEAEVKTLKKQKKARQDDEEGKGDYGDGKARINSRRLRVVTNRLRETGSILILINQTRDNIGFTAKFQPKTRSGGRALKFYARLEMWLSSVGTVKKTIRGKPRKLGIISKIDIQKNSLTGRKRTVLVPVLYSSGIDDLGSCIDFLLEEKVLTGKEGNLKAPDFNFEGSKEKLIRHIEREGLEKELHLMVSATWKEIEKASELKRKPRYE
jgi:RecA/RadA recombinase